MTAVVMRDRVLHFTMLMVPSTLCDVPQLISHWVCLGSSLDRHGYDHGVVLVTENSKTYILCL